MATTAVVPAFIAKPQGKPSGRRGISILDYRHPYGVYVQKCKGATAHLGYIVTCYDTDGNEVGRWNCPSDHDTAASYPASLSAFVRDCERWLRREYPDWRNLQGARAKRSRRPLINN